MKPGSVVTLPKYGMLEEEGQVSVCQGVGCPQSPFSENFCAWLLVEPFYTHLHERSIVSLPQEIALVGK